MHVADIGDMSALTSRPDNVHVNLINQEWKQTCLTTQRFGSTAPKVCYVVKYRVMVTNNKPWKAKFGNFVLNYWLRTVFMYCTHVMYYKLTVSSTPCLSQLDIDNGSQEFFWTIPYFPYYWVLD